MPPYGHLPKENLDALTVYMLSLREAPARLLAAPNVFSLGQGNRTEGSQAK